jgi:hypothetical protein
VEAVTWRQRKAASHHPGRRQANATRRPQQAPHNTDTSQAQPITPTPAEAIRYGRAHPAAQVTLSRHARMLPRLLNGPHRLLLGGPHASGAAPLHRRRVLAGRRAMSASASPAPAPGPKRPLRGVVFDMDGTLTVPVIDFPAMYREVLGGDAAYAAARGSGGGSVDILHCIEDWAPDKQRHAYEVIARFEREGLDRLQIMPGRSAGNHHSTLLALLLAACCEYPRFCGV